MKKFYATLLLTLFLPLIAWSEVLDPVTIEIDARLVAMEKTWNVGDLDAFLMEYAPSATTTYVSSTGIIHGYKNIVKRLLPNV